MVTNEFGPLYCDHGKRSTPLRVKKDVAHRRGGCGWESGGRANEQTKGRQIRTRSNHHGAPDDVRRTEPHESRRFGKPFPTYGARHDKANILHAVPEPAARPPGAPRPRRRQARDGDEEPVHRAKRNGANEDESGIAVYGALGTGPERCRRDVQAEQLVTERVHGAQARLHGGQLAARTERCICGKGEGASWNWAI